MFQTYSSPVAQPVQSKSRNRILIVEDEPLIGLGLKDSLECAGHDVVWVQSDRAAYAALRGLGRPFEILILDIDLGVGTTGFDIARTARTANPQVGVIFSSGSPPDWLKHFGVDKAIFLPKPCTEFGLLAAVSGLSQELSTAD
ncbi:response regulator [Sphingomonas sp.]|jgi:DNA-binding response OmpR family regulator|uniref:response regulator n=1 Tax=Sphingomonas sp. TaxID=28214 RepID=UPI002DE41E79|nr:response regulator [Sphingomonas sp.]HEV2568845.1 response regulator [Sphingomonas sp.]